MKHILMAVKYLLRASAAGIKFIVSTLAKIVSFIMDAFLIPSQIAIGLIIAYMMIYIAPNMGRVSLYATDDLPAFDHKDYETQPKNGIDPLIRLHYESEDYQFNCTGFVVSNDYAITAGHCVGATSGKIEQGKIKIVDTNGNETGVFAKAVGFSTRLDVGLIKGDFKKFRKYKINERHSDLISRESAKFPHPYLACGFPMGGDKFCSDVTVIGVGAFFVVGAGELYPGMSGGPLLDESLNEVVGINSSVPKGGLNNFSPLVNIWAMFDIETK